VLVLNTKLLQDRGIPEAKWPRQYARFDGPVLEAAMAANQNEIDCHEQTDSRHVATHAACLFQVWGTAKARDWYLKLRDNGAEFVAGNQTGSRRRGPRAVADWLDRHRRRHREVDAGRPVRIVFPDAGAAADSGLGTLFIPTPSLSSRDAPTRPEHRGWSTTC